MSFLKRVAAAVRRRITAFVSACVKHTEAITILSLAAIGANALLSELPFYIAMPMWIEGAFVIPVLACSIVLLLTKSMEWRANRRQRFPIAVAA